jgi:hypothetical protein
MASLMYILFLVLSSSSLFCDFYSFLKATTITATTLNSLFCRFLLFPKSHHNNSNNIELTTCNNDNAATASQLLYCNSATVVIGVISINTKKVTKTSVMISVGTLDSQKNTWKKSRKRKLL